MKLVHGSLQLRFSFTIGALIVICGALLFGGANAVAAGAKTSGKAKIKVTPPPPVATEPAIPTKESSPSDGGEEALTGEDGMPDEPISDLKRPAGAGDDYPGDDLLFEDQEAKDIKGDDADVPDTTAFDSDERRQLAEFKLGPSVSLGLPQPLTYGLEILHGGLIGGAFSLGSMNTKVSGTKIALSNWDARFRWFPWRSSFFGGLAFGQQKASAEVEKDALDIGGPTKYDASIKLVAKTSYVTPHVGWSSSWDSGFTLGFDVGVQLPVKSKEEFNAKFDGNLNSTQEAQLKDTAAYKKLETDAKSLAKKVGKTPLPYLSLLRVGWLF